MKYALIIGNNKYEEPKLAQLRTPAADSQALAKVLGDKGIGAFDKVISIIDQQENQIRRSISSFLLNKKPEDLVLVYFSGHGILDDRGRLFLASRDTQVNLLTATAIPSSFITDELDSCRSKRQILILDCCHSGAYARGTKGEQKAVTHETFQGAKGTNGTNGYGRVVLTASASTQYALEGNQILEQSELSLFTHFLLEGLQTGQADLDNNGIITLDEWYDYTYEQVIGQTPNQIPHKWSYSQQGDLVIATNPFAKKKIIELPLEIVQAIDSPFVTIRENAVIELKKLLRSREIEMVDLAYSALEKMTEDDSKKVSSIAQKILAEFQEKQKITNTDYIGNLENPKVEFTETQKPLNKYPFLVQKILDLTSQGTKTNLNFLALWASAYFFLIPAIPIVIFFRENIMVAIGICFTTVIDFFKFPNVIITLLSYVQGPFVAISIVVSIATIQLIITQRRKTINFSWVIFSALTLIGVSVLLRLIAVNIYYSFVNKHYGSYWDFYTITAFIIVLFFGLAENVYIGAQLAKREKSIYPFIHFRTGPSMHFWNQWIFASLVGVFVWSIISYLLPNSYLVKYSILGAAIGISQWWVLQPRTKSWWWFLFNISLGVFLSPFLANANLYYWYILLWYVLNFIGLLVYLRITKK